MGYSKNPALVDAAMPLLQELKAGRSCRWRTALDWPSTEKLHRRLRQALYISSLHPDRFPELAAAAKNFSLHVVEPGLIEARQKRTANVETDATAQSFTMGGPVHGREIPKVAAASAADIIDSWVRHLPSSDPIHFEQTTLPESELTELYRWCKDQSGPERAILVGKGFITVSLMEKGLPEWTPPAGTVPITRSKIYDIDPD